MQYPDQSVAKQSQLGMVGAMYLHEDINQEMCDPRSTHVNIPSSLPVDITHENCQVYYGC